MTSASEVYEACCRYLVENGWRREEEVSGWWWKDGENDAEMGAALDAQLYRDRVDLRVRHSWEPEEFWG